MGFVDDLINDDAGIFVDPDFGFGEAITYKPKGGTPRTIYANVERMEINPVDPFQRVTTVQIEITVKNNSTTGISYSEINTGGDAITVARQLGQTPDDRLLGKVVAQDNGMMRISLK